MKMIESQEQFEQEVLQAKGTVLVDFYADWCGPCKAMAPILEAMDADAKDYEIAKVDVDKLPELAQAYNVASIPTLLVFRQGESVNRSIGTTSREELESILG